MITTFFRILKYGFLNFWRNGWLSTATVFIMTLTLLMFQGLILFDVVTNAAVNSIRDKIDIAVYFKQDVIEDDIISLQRSLERLPEIKDADYISASEALEIFKEKHADDVTITQALAELNENPLLASLNISANDTKDYADISAYLEKDDFSSIVEKVTFGQNKGAIDRLNNIVDTSNKVGLIFTLFIAFVAILVSFNTIRLAIYSNREEISIMRLVGASNYFTKGPYLVSGILYGICGAVATLIISMPIINFIAPHFDLFIPELGLQAYFYANITILFGYLVAGGIVLGLLSSFIAIRRYLKV
ncbi:MAG: hypothetical protein COU06_01560 [Candidatus Harrisonbacteria bacterium CG10_big_fil_rev_8_21_14_0_10_38_8]|uniref:Cell division protein FtsX n=1 Tax=Candidatus Harrisonbacteria bacterium CG10_big_fil_rev_8_21_14_0_10_38_8 TaxID=1974582 RepID=A0A2M6WK65_9BACT|nr:MAG: hypothetical protein COU06_01560 [Candidatus Harrisonbacteria bacterium CG10_big_fil_rev_8_21_14_0_10_38_8]